MKDRAGAGERAGAAARAGGGASGVDPMMHEASRQGQARELLQLDAAPAARSALSRSIEPSGMATSAMLQSAQFGSPGDAAQAGFGEGGGAVPYQAEMEESFGVSFAGVEAHRGPAAKQANTALDAQAYTMGDQMAFADRDPRKSLVAHELTHTLQQQGRTGPALKASGGGGGVGVDTAGEAQAEAVEAAVAGGGKASDVLGPISAAGARDEAIQRKYGLSMTFSTEGFKRDHEYKLWGTAARIPLGTLPAFFLIDPSVKVFQTVGVGVRDGGNMSMGLGVKGSVGLGFSAGVPNVFEPYLTGNPTVTGQGMLKLGQGSQFALTAGVDFSVAGFIGAKIGGVFNPRFKLGGVDIFKLTGIYIDNNGFDGSKIGFRWSDEVQAAFDALADLYEYVMSGVGAAADWAAGTATAVADGYRESWRRFNSLFSW